MKKKILLNKILSVLLAVCISVTCFSFPVFNIRSSALGFTATIIIAGILLAASGIAANVIAQGAGVGCNEVNDWWNGPGGSNFRNNVNSLVNKDDVIQIIEDDHGHKYAQVNPELSLNSSETRIANDVVNALNSDIDKYLVFIEEPDGPFSTPVCRVNSNGYKLLKELFVNSIVDEANTQCQNDTNQLIFDLGSALGGDVRYNFSFVGDTPSFGYTTAVSSGLGGLIKNGYIYSVPFSYACSYEEVENAADSSGSHFTYDSRSHTLETVDYSLGCGFYAFNDSELWVSYSYNNNIIIGCNGSGRRDYININTGKSISFVPGDGYYYGLYINLTNVDMAGQPPVEGFSSTDEFYQTTGGTSNSIPFPRTSSENTVGGATALGLISSSSPLTIDDAGNITAVNDIPIEQIQQILNDIISGDLDLESIEEYLSLISTLVANGNMTEAQQKAILDGINTNILAQSKTLTDIKDILKEISDSKAEAAALDITASYDFDIDTPNTIIDKFPFSLPFDIYNAFNILSANPEAPVFSIPIKMQGVFDFTIDIDLSDYDWIANIVRWFLYIIFIIGLILVTNKLIGRG